LVEVIITWVILALYMVNSSRNNKENLEKKLKNSGSPVKDFALGILNLAAGSALIAGAVYYDFDSKLVTSLTGVGSGMLYLNAFFKYKSMMSYNSKHSGNSNK